MKGLWLKELWHGYRDNFLDQAGDIVRFIKRPFRNVNWYAWGEVLASITVALSIIGLIIGAIILGCWATLG